MGNRTIFRTRRRRARWRRLLTLCLAFLAVTTTASALIESGSKSVSRPRGDAARSPRPARPRPKPKPAPVRPPQFLVVSFDGSGGTQLWPYWRNVARRAGAHFTFFVSGVYLLDGARRDLYHPPRHDVGYSAIGFAQPMDGLSARARIRETLQQIGLAYREGNEIGTHFNGHFCAPFPGSVGEWTSADWSGELDQFTNREPGDTARHGVRAERQNR